MYGPFHLPPPTLVAIPVGNAIAAAGAVCPEKVILDTLHALFTWKMSLVGVLGKTFTVLKSSPTTAVNAGSSIGLLST